MAKYYRWHGTDMEGRGLEVDRAVVAEAEALRRGDDRQLSGAVSATASGRPGA